MRRGCWLGRWRWCAVLLAVFGGVGALPAPAAAAFGLVPESFQATALNRDGSVDVHAGSHPYSYNIDFEFNHDSEANAEGSARDIVVVLPAGLIGNATAVPHCARSDLEGTAAKCPGNTQIGTFRIAFREPEEGLAPSGAVYNLVPPRGAAASFGFESSGFNAIENATLIRSSGTYRVAVTTSNVAHGHTLSVAETIWGVPADVGHDSERECIVNGLVVVGCSTDTVPAPFLTLPTSCGTPLETILEADSVEAPGDYLRASTESLDAGGSPVGLFDCESLDFAPSISVRPDTNATASPTGLHIDLHLPQRETVDGLGEADLRDASVMLPAGVVVNPSSANGLGACTSGQIRLESTEPSECPDAAKIGTAEVDTQLLDHPARGQVYLAAQNDNPFHSLLAIYIVVEDPETGSVVKLAGHVEADRVTGQLVTRFAENPQIPFEDLKLDLPGGPRASLLTPDTCGAMTTATDLVPWSTPEGHDATPTSTFEITSGTAGAPCPSTPQSEPNSPGFEAGTTVPLAASYSPFVLRIDREQGTQQIAQIESTLPRGLTGKLAGIPRCTDTQIAAAQEAGRSGAQERAYPSCPANTEVGASDVGAGAGGITEQVHVAGRLYLAGPYRGAPFSIVDITPAVAGPFDLGVVVVRSALYVSPQTAQVSVRSDPIPTILQGIPLDVRSIVIDVNRNQFTLNPTNCEHMSVTGIVTSTFGQSAFLSNPFQVGGCAGLAFKPTFVASTQGKTSKRNGASLRVKVSEKPGEANIHKVDLQLPVALPSRLTTIQKACLAAQFAADPAGCPEGSVIGSAKAVTPLFASPLVGPAYLVSHGGVKFPDVVFLLQGEGVKIELTGNIDIKKGITYSKFESAPDAPISSFETTLPEGPHSALSGFGDLCAKGLVIPTTLVGQNGAVVARDTKVSVVGCPKPTIKVTQVSLRGARLLVSFTTSQPGIATLGGQGLKAFKKMLTTSGEHRALLSLTGAGRKLHAHHTHERLRISVKGPGGTTNREIRVQF